VFVTNRFDQSPNPNRFERRGGKEEGKRVSDWRGEKRGGERRKSETNRDLRLTTFYTLDGLSSMYG